MAVSSSPSKNSHTHSKLLSDLSEAYPQLRFRSGLHYSWSAKSNTIQYIDQKKTVSAVDTAALLHEVAHADLAHDSFRDDFELLQLEVAAWQRAKEIGLNYGVAIDEEHIQDCLDTYRDWLHARAKCPTCSVVSIQTNQGLYQCFNCKTSWKVPKSQLCRVRRTVVKS
jgi:hypothetical protein